MDKATFLKRARARSEQPDDYWAKIADIVQGKPGIGISDRQAYTQRVWNWLQQAKAQLKQPWEA